MIYYPAQIIVTSNDQLVIQATLNSRKVNFIFDENRRSGVEHALSSIKTDWEFINSDEVLVKFKDVNVLRNYKAVTDNFAEVCLTPKFDKDKLTVAVHVIIHNFRIRYKLLVTVIHMTKQNTAKRTEL